MISGAEKVDDPVLRKMSRSAKAVEVTLRPDVSNPLFSPLIHPKCLGGLLPAYIQVKGMDPLREYGLDV